MRQGREIILLILALVLTPAESPAVTLDENGQAVVRLAADEYRNIVAATPAVSDRKLVSYLEGIASRLLPAGTSFPTGIKVSVTVLDKAMPEVYSLADGRILITSGAVQSAANEAQLAALLAHEVSHIAGAHYPSIYQAYKDRERRNRQGLLASGLAGVVMDQAIDFTLRKKTDKVYADADEGRTTYRKAREKVAALEAGSATLQGFREVYDGLPPETKAGEGDPRLPLELVADAESLTLMVKAGYDPAQAAEAWRLLRQRADKVRQGSTEALAASFLPPQYRTLITGVSDPMGNIRAEALTRTVSDNPPDRPAFLEELTGSREIADLSKGKSLTRGEKEFAAVFGGYSLAAAKAAFASGNYAEAKRLYQAAWDSGQRTAETAYALGRSQYGDFAFAAAPAEKEAGERYLREAVKLDPRMPEPYKALGELYGEWERYDEAAEMYQKYLKAAPGAPDRAAVEKEMEKMKRKARR